MLRTWNRPDGEREGEKSMHLTHKISGDDSCIIAMKWHNGLLCVGKHSLLNPTYFGPL